MSPLHIPPLFKSQLAFSFPCLRRVVWLLIIVLAATASAAAAQKAVHGLQLRSLTPGELHIQWTAPDLPPTDYRVNWGPADERFPGWRDASGNVFATGTALTLRNLQPGADYKVRVRARYGGSNAHGPRAGGFSAAVQQRIDDYHDDTATEGTVTVGGSADGEIDSSGDVDWFAVEMTASQVYDVTVADDDADAEAGLGSQLIGVYDADGTLVSEGVSWSGTAGLSFTPSVSGTYHVSVAGTDEATGGYTVSVSERSAAVGSGDESEDGADDTDTAADSLPPASLQGGQRQSQGVPGAPTGLLTAASHESVLLMWTDPGDASITGYQVLRGLNAASLAVLVEDTGNASTRYTDRSVVADTSYVYAIKARNAHGLSPQSGATTATTPAAAVEPPTARAAATGQPTISGTAEAGEALEADTSPIMDTDGITMISNTLSYQWVRVDGMTETDIGGATSQTYTLTSDDVGKKIKVKVTFTDDASNSEEVESDAFPATGTVTVSTNADLSDLVLTDPDGNEASFDPGFASDTFSYDARAVTTAYRVTISPTISNPNATYQLLDGDDVLLTDADGNTADFQVNLPIGGATVKVKVTAQDTTTTETYTVTISRTDFLVSNSDRTSGGVIQFVGTTHFSVFQAFRTGGASGGYVISEVIIQVSESTSQVPTIAIHRHRDGGFNRDYPGAHVVDLHGGDFSSAGSITLRPEKPVTLARNRTYGINIIMESAGSGVEFATARDTEKNPRSAPGWNVANGITIYGVSSGLLTGDPLSRSMRVTVRGAAANGDTSLSALTLTDTADNAALDLSPEFLHHITSYTAEVGAEQVTLSPTAHDSDAAVEYLDDSSNPITDADLSTPEFDFDLGFGHNVVKVRVTAANGVDQRVYTLSVKRNINVAIASSHAQIVAKLHVPTFTLTHNDPVGQAVDVTVKLANVGSGNVISSSGRQQTVSFAANDDTVDFTPPAFWIGTGSGEFTATVEPPDQYNGGSVTVEALDVSTAVTVSVEEERYEVPEGEGPFRFKLKAVTIDDIAVPNQSFQVSVVTEQRTAKLRADYGAISVIRTFETDIWTAVGNHHVGLAAPLEITIPDDSVYEGGRTGENEYFVLRVQGTGGLPSVVKLAAGVSRVEIVDDETLAITTTLAKTSQACTTPGLSVDQCAPADLTTSAETGVVDLSVAEDFASDIWLRVDTGTGTTGDPVTLNDDDKFQIAATPDADHGASEGVDWSIDVTEIAADDRAVITVRNDQNPESNESVQFTVSLPGDAQVAASTVTLHILDDERPTPPLLAELAIESEGARYALEQEDINTYTTNVPGTSSGNVTVSLFIETLDSAHAYELQDDSSQTITDSDTNTNGDQVSVQMGTNTIVIVVKDGSNAQLARYTLKINVLQGPSRLPAPTLTRPAGTNFRLTVTWTTPSSGTADLAGYDIRYRTASDRGAWIEVLTHDLATTRTLANLIPRSRYEVQVRAKNNEVPGPWSPSATGRSSGSDNRYEQTPEIFVNRGARMDPSSDKRHRFRILLPDSSAYRFKARGSTDKTVTVKRLNGSTIDSNTGTGANHAIVAYTPPGRSVYYVEVTKADYVLVEPATRDANVFAPPRRDCVGWLDYCSTPPPGHYYVRECQSSADYPTCIVDIGTYGFGSLHTASDVDAWSVILESEATYIITVRGAGDQSGNDNGGTLPDPKLEILEMVSYDKVNFAFTWRVVQTSTQQAADNRNIKYEFQVPQFIVQAPWLLQVTSGNQPSGAGTYIIGLHEKE